MGSFQNSNPWSPYDNYRDCSQGICSRFCPQFCYLIFPPPPSDDDSGTPFSPLIIAIIGVLASAFILVSYYTIVTRYCKRRIDHNSRVENRDEIAHDQWQVVSTGLDEALIKSITVCKYKKGDGLIEETECAVCLSEFEEDESLRLLPKCSHAFHLPCIDTWLKSHSNCPLCRANVVSLAQSSVSPPPLSSSRTSSALNTSTYEFRPPNDLILVVDNQEMDCRERIVVRFVNDDDNEDNSDVSPNQENLNTEDSETRNGNTGNDEESSVKQIKTSISLGTFSCQSHPIISDVLKIEENDEDLQVKSNNQSWRGIGCSKGSRDVGLVPSPVSTKRSISSGRFMFTIHDKGKNSMLPN